jgi:hypothetical protein
MMETRITVVDGCDGLTPDMLRCVPRQRDIDAFDRVFSLDLFGEEPAPPAPWYFQDRMHE